MARVKSMEVAIRGVTKTFDFDPPAKVNAEDGVEAAAELLREAETFDVELGGGLVSAEVEVEYSIRGTASFTLDEDQLEAFEDEDELQAALEEGYDFRDEVWSAVEYDVDIDSAELDFNVSVEEDE